MRRISLKEEQVEIADRVFVMREHTGKQLEQYIQHQTQGYQHMMALFDVNAPPEGVAEKAADMVYSSDALFIMLLVPADKKPPITPDWIAENLSSDMKSQIITIQDELNNMEAILGKLQEAQRLVETQKNLNLDLEAAIQKQEKRRKIRGTTSAVKSESSTDKTPSTAFGPAGPGGNFS